MIALFSKGENLVGVDIGSHSIKMVQVRAGSAKPKLINFGLAPLPREAYVEGRMAKPEIVSDTIRQLANHLKIKQKSVAISVSGYDVMIKKIELPTMPAEELDTRMHSELGQYIPYNVEEVDIDYHVMEASKDRPNFMDVLLVAAKKESIGDHRNLLRAAGFEPYVVDVDFFALGNAFEATYGFGDDSVALLDIGATKSIMNIALKGMPVFTRGISIGGNQLTEAIKDHFRISFEEAESLKLGETAADAYPAGELEEIYVSTVRNWVSECGRAVDFYYNNYPDKRISTFYLSGGSSRIPGMDKAFQDNLELPVELFNPVSRTQYDPKTFDPAYIDYVGPQMAISLGLALRKTKEK
ncbi:MAG: type IV pilus assembly protein PilM [Syntrophobacter sp.]